MLDLATALEGPGDLSGMSPEQEYEKLSEAYKLGAVWLEKLQSQVENLSQFGTKSQIKEHADEIVRLAAAQKEYSRAMEELEPILKQRKEDAEAQAKRDAEEEARTLSAKGKPGIAQVYL